MPTAPLVSLIFPAYNERRRILKTIQDAVSFFESRNLSFEIIVAADGNDGTGDLVRKSYEGDARLVVLESNERRGKGDGIRRAIQVAQGQFIGYSDADGKTPFVEFGRFLPALQEGTQLVIGNRWHEQKGDPTRKWYRKIGSIVFVKLMQTVVGLRGIQDTQCGFKFFSAQAAKILFSSLSVSGYMFDVEILLKAKRLGYSVAQVPVSFQDDLDTRLNLWTGNLANIRDILKLKLSFLWNNPT